MAWPAFTQKLSGHLTRWLVALVCLPPILYLILTDRPLLFGGLILVAGGLVWWEYFNNLLGRERPMLLVLSLLGWLAVVAGTQFFGPQGQQGGLLIALGLGAVYALVNLPKLNGPILLNVLGRYALGHLYLSLGLSFLLLLRQLTLGAQWVIYLLAVNMIADTAAFYVGTNFKGPKLCPKISPGKTISGLAGGLLAAVLVSLVSALYLPPEATWPKMAVLGLVVGLLGVFGDLFESALKRALEIKDSSGLLLGHGGFWDRLDSLIFTGGPVYLFAAVWMGP